MKLFAILSNDTILGFTEDRELAEEIAKSENMWAMERPKIVNVWMAENPRPKHRGPENDKWWIEYYDKLNSLRKSHKGVRIVETNLLTVADKIVP